MSLSQVSAELGSLLLADGRLPTGSYSHSAGLEAAVRSGLTVAQIPDYLEARLRTVGLVEAAAAVLARQTAGMPSGPVPRPSGPVLRSSGPALRSTAAGQPRVLDAPVPVEVLDEVDVSVPVEVPALLDVQLALLARTPSAALRTASGLLGRGLLRLGERLYPDHPGVRQLSGWTGPPLRPVALGVLGAAIGMDDGQVARASLYDDVQTVTAAALKLLPVDPVETIGWVLDCAQTLETMVGRAQRVHDTTDLPALAAPVVEQWSLDHETSSRRIFVS